jgi:uncharacterized membrane protein YeaQ/YmgE (transglycosylase-associated protein family)
MTFFSWIFVGLIAGALAKLVFPGPNGNSWFRTMILGILGGLIGGYLGSALLASSGMTGFDFNSILHATGGSLVVLVAHHFLGKKKGGWPDHRRNS